MHIRGPKKFSYGYHAITSMDDTTQNTLMDFGLLRMKEDDIFAESQNLERAYLLVHGHITLEYGSTRQEIQRENCFDFAPWVLHVPAKTPVRLIAHADSEITVHRTPNDNHFAAKVYTPEECASEHRGAGTMRETSTRIVRTVFDQSNAPYSKLVLGEVIGFPGKWSSYPPHHHLQPEIYFYRFLPKNGYGFAELDENVIKTHHNSTVLITKDETHPQVTAPGYAMWYLWVIRNLDGNPYIAPTFVPEHEWVTQPDAEIWPKEG